MMAAQRSRELSVGGELTVDRDNDKNPVVALREIADETIPLTSLKLRSSKVCSAISTSMKSSKRKMKICSR